MLHCEGHTVLLWAAMYRGQCWPLSALLAWFPGDTLWGLCMVSRPGTANLSLSTSLLHLTLCSEKPFSVRHRCFWICQQWHMPPLWPCTPRPQAAHQLDSLLTIFEAIQGQAHGVEMNSETQAFSWDYVFSSVFPLVLARTVSRDSIQVVGQVTGCIWQQEWTPKPTSAEHRLGMKL